MAVFTRGITEDNPALCCSPRQIREMAKNLAIPHDMLGRCPSCYHNFKNIFCGFTCDPQQSVFMRAVNTIPIPPGKETITEVDYAISEEFSQAMFDRYGNVHSPLSH